MSGVETWIEVSKLKEGSYIMIDKEPCRVVSISKSKPGKHGAAKARIVAIGLFDGQKRTIIKSTADRLPVPTILKREGEIINISGNEIEVMDSETYETVTLRVPDQWRNKISIGRRIEFWIVAGRPLFIAVKRER